MLGNRDGCLTTPAKVLYPARANRIVREIQQKNWSGPLAAPVASLLSPSARLTSYFLGFAAVEAALPDSSAVLIWSVPTEKADSRGFSRAPFQKPVSLRTPFATAGCF